MRRRWWWWVTWERRVLVGTLWQHSTFLNNLLSLITNDGRSRTIDSLYNRHKHNLTLITAQSDNTNLWQGKSSVDLESRSRRLPNLTGTSLSNGTVHLYEDLNTVSKEMSQTVEKRPILQCWNILQNVPGCDSDNSEIQTVLSSFFHENRFSIFTWSY